MTVAAIERVRGMLRLMCRGKSRADAARASCLQPQTAANLMTAYYRHMGIDGAWQNRLAQACYRLGREEG